MKSMPEINVTGEHNLHSDQFCERGLERVFYFKYFSVKVRQDFVTVIINSQLGDFPGQCV